MCTQFWEKQVRFTHPGMFPDAPAAGWVQDPERPLPTQSTQLRGLVAQD